MIVLGLDPGIAGAFAILDGDSILIDDLPLHQAQHGKSAKVRAELDLHTLRIELEGRAIEHAFIEQVAARPGQGTVSMFRFGFACGAVTGLLVAMGISITTVRPQEWQKHHRVGPSPDAARQRAVQLYPSVAASLTRKRDQHRADALLLACYGRFTLNGHSAGMTAAAAE